MSLFDAPLAVPTAAYAGIGNLDWDDDPIADQPQVVWEELREQIVDALVNQPRSLQKRIGPSEIGEPCTRALIHKLAGDPEPPRADPGWQAWVGTQMHAGLEAIFSRSWQQTVMDKPRYLLESRVYIGDVDGVRITGSCDAFDTLTGTVIDWKTKGKNTLAEHKRHGPGEKYRVQFHSYGQGMVNAGHRVKRVMGVFLPRDGRLSEAYMWAERFDPTVAATALRRVDELARLVRLFGRDAALSMYPEPCSDRWCDWCKSPAQLDSRAGHGAPRTTPVKGVSTLRDLLAAN